MPADRASLPDRARALRRLAGTAPSVVFLLLTACGPAEPGSSAGGPDTGTPLFEDLEEFTGVTGEPVASASDEFWARWGDGRAEMSGYSSVTMRYGEPREGELVLTYVTEPHDRRTWIKDDDVEEPHRVNVLKLNANQHFLTGIYPYYVMTSIYAPVHRWRTEAFSPVKISLSAQEWCGHVRRTLWTAPEGFRMVGLSYFASEGERTRTVDTGSDVLYEDALLIQLRELDGPFADGGDWEGRIVPTLWDHRTAHEPLDPVSATITRTDAERDGAPVTRFELSYGDYTRTFDVEKEPPRRILGWENSRGERARILATERMAYWRLNGPGGREHRTRLGLSPEPFRIPAPAP